MATHQTVLLQILYVIAGFWCIVPVYKGVEQVAWEFTCEAQLFLLNVTSLGPGRPREVGTRQVAPAVANLGSVRESEWPKKY